MPSSIAPLFIIVSRDRPNAVAACLESIARFTASRWSEGASAWVVDDSTTPPARQQMHDVVAAASTDGMSVTYRGTVAEQHQVLDHVPATATRYIRPLGSAGWNLGFARNFVWLLARRELAPDRGICVLDDDVRLTPQRYAGRWLEPRLDDLFDVAAEFTARGETFLIGPEFLGREDVTITRHFAKATRRPEHAVPATARSIPIHVAAEPTDLDPPERVPSGGLCLTSPRTLALAPLTHFYNEDWIWGLVLSRLGVHVERTNALALHVPGPEPWPPSAKVIQQETGELVYQTIATNWPPGATGIRAPTLPELERARAQHLGHLEARRTTVEHAGGAGPFPTEDDRRRALELVTVAIAAIANLDLRELQRSVATALADVAPWLTAIPVRPPIASSDHNTTQV